MRVSDRKIEQESLRQRAREINYIVNNIMIWRGVTERETNAGTERQRERELDGQRDRQK